MVTSEAEVARLKYSYFKDNGKFTASLAFGKESFEVSDMELRFSGWIPPKVISRWKALTNMGVASYYSSFYESILREPKSLNDLSEKLAFKVFKLKRNFIVILWVLSGGLTLGVLVHIYELRCVICKATLRKTKKISY